MAHELDVAAFLSGHVIVNDDRQLSRISFGQRSGTRFRNQQIRRAHELGDFVGEAHDGHRRGKRWRKIFEFRAQRFVAPTHDDQMHRQFRLRERERRRHQFAAAFAAGHEQRNKLVLW